MGAVAGGEGQWLWGRDPRADFPSEAEILDALTRLGKGSSMRVGGLGIVRDADGSFLLDDETVQFLDRMGVHAGPRAGVTPNTIPIKATQGYATARGMLGPVMKWGELPRPGASTSVRVSPFNPDVDLASLTEKVDIGGEVSSPLDAYLGSVERSDAPVVVGQHMIGRTDQGRLMPVVTPGAAGSDIRKSLTAAGYDWNSTLRGGGYSTPAGLAKYLSAVRPVDAPIATAPSVPAGLMEFPSVAALSDSLAALSDGQSFNLGDAAITRTGRGWEFSHPEFRGKLGMQANVLNSADEAASYLGMLYTQNAGRYFPGYAAPAAPEVAPVPEPVPPSARIAGDDQGSGNGLVEGHIHTDMLGREITDQPSLFPPKTVTSAGSGLERFARGVQAGWLDALRDNPHDLSELFMGPFAGLQTDWAKETVSSLGTSGRIGGALGSALGHAIGLWPLRIMWRAHPYDVASSVGTAEAARQTGLATAYQGYGQKEINELNKVRELRDGNDKAFERAQDAAGAILDPELADDHNLPYVKLGDLHLLKLDPSGHLPRRIAAPLGAGIAFATALGSSNMNLGGLFNLEEGPRARGYKAALANQDDPTKTTFYPWSVVEGLIAGGSSRPLDWNRFHQERPEVTRQQYDAYDRYNKGMEAEEGDPASFSLMGGLVKGTTSNLEGTPELRVMGGRVTPFGVAAGIGAGLIGGAAVKDYISRAYDQAQKSGGVSSLDQLRANDDMMRSRNIYNAPLSAFDIQPDEKWYNLPFMQARKQAVGQFQSQRFEDYTPEQRRAFMADMDEIQRQQGLFAGSTGLNEKGGKEMRPGPIYREARDKLYAELRGGVRAANPDLTDDQVTAVLKDWTQQKEGKRLARDAQIAEFFRAQPKAAARFFGEAPAAEAMAQSREKILGWALKNLGKVV